MSHVEQHQLQLFYVSYNHALKIYFFCMLISWLIVCGDVEINPGPADNPVKEHLSVFHLNIRSVRNKLNVLEDIAADYDSVCVTETHLDAKIDTDDICIPGFSKPFRDDRTCSGGGILIYVSDRLFVNRVNDLEFHGGENICIRITLPTYILHLCTTYRPESCITGQRGRGVKVQNWPHILSKNNASH